MLTQIYTIQIQISILDRWFFQNLGTYDILDVRMLPVPSIVSHLCKSTCDPSGIVQGSSTKQKALGASLIKGSFGGGG